MGSFDKGFLFTDIALEENFEICTNGLFKESETVDGLSKSELKELFLLLLKTEILFLMKHFINKLVVWPWVVLHVLR